MIPRQLIRLLSLLALFSFLFPGCARGPKWIRSDWRQYNDSFVDVSNKELLLNIVRLRYNDYPGVLKIGSLTAQRSWTVNGNIAGGLTEGGPHTLSSGVGGLHSERPTVAFLPGNKSSINGTLTPLSLESLFLASYLEWPASTYWPLMVKSLNGVKCAAEGGGPIPIRTPEVAEFFQLAVNLRELQEQGMIEVGRIEIAQPINEHVDAASLTAAESRAAALDGYSYKTSDEPGKLVLSRVKQVSVLRFAEDAAQTPQYDAIVKLLKLDPNRLEYNLEPAFQASLKPESQRRDDIEVGLRSLMEMMFLVSKGVQVPKCHLVNNVAPSDDSLVNWDPLIGGFRVVSCAEEPECAAVKVCYRGTWFYIPDNDQSSKTTFFFIKLISDAQIQGGGAENLPVLTLPL